jgi:glycogen operon protein
MDRADILSYRVLFFERDGTVFRAPETYPAKAVACVATHDLPTLKGWWSGADIALDRTLGRTTVADADKLRDADREALSSVIGAKIEELTPANEAAIHGYLARAPSVLVLAQAEDLAGEAEPVNVPGTEAEYPNWRRRIAEPVESLLETPTAEAVLAAMKAAGR